MKDRLLTASEVGRLREADLTYREVGRTRSELPDGYHHQRRSAVIGKGQDRFREASDALLRWGVQRGAGLGVRPSTVDVMEGSVAVLDLGVGRLALHAPVRVVYVVDEPNRRGFGYGTLPGHPESGEESFLVSLQADGRVMADVTAFSRHASRLARLGGPVTSLAQLWAINRYLRAMAFSATNE